jgi:hypothetical protein
MFLHDGASGNVAGSVVVDCHRRGGLGVPHFGKHDAEGTRFFAVVEDGAKFNFGSARKNFAHDVAQQDVRGTVGLEGVGGLGLFWLSKSTPRRGSVL